MSYAGRIVDHLTYRGVAAHVGGTGGGCEAVVVETQAFEVLVSDGEGNLPDADSWTMISYRDNVTERHVGVDLAPGTSPVEIADVAAFAVLNGGRFPAGLTVEEYA